ncbi:MAG: sulfite exporter TauE/SafE family protein [Armatimonas sp.]
MEILGYSPGAVLGLWLLGFAVGTLGTLIGAGGGFLLAPALLLLYPNERPETIAAISLAVVFFNAASGSFAYAHQRRIDYRSGLIFAAASVPGALLGAYSTNFLPRKVFDMLFGCLLLLARCVRGFRRSAAARVGYLRMPYRRGDQSKPHG